MGVLVAGVCLEPSSGEIALAPQLGILGRGVHQVNGQWGSIVPAFQPTAAALLVSGQPRDRMGFVSPARQYARYQFQWHVHRIARSVVDRSRFYGASGAGSACKSRLLGEAHRARTWHGRGGNAFGRATRATVSGSSSFSFQHRFLTPSYTMVAAARIASRCVNLDSPPFVPEWRLRSYEFDQMP
jgi:hypothetical protein